MLNVVRGYILPPFEGDIRHYAPMFAAFATLLVIGLVAWCFRQVSLSVRNVGVAFASSGLLGLLAYWFRYEGTPYFDLNFWVWIPFLVLAISLVWVLTVHFVSVPRKKALEKKQQIKSKYLPSRRRP